MEVLAGIDFGGTAVKLGLVDRGGKMIARGTVAVDPRAGFESIMSAVSGSLEALIESLPQTGTLSAIGIGTPGFTDTQSGILVEGCRNIPTLQGRSVQGYMADRFGVPAVADNDGTCAATGERVFGAGRKYRNFVLITIGTGIGGGLVLDGRVFHGAKGYAAELGHMCMDPHGPWCICGSRGCFEQYSSGTALLASYNSKAAKRGLESAASARVVVDRARDGDPLARLAIQEAASRIAQAFGTLLNILNLEACIVGGGVSRAGDILLDPVRAQLPDHCWPVIGRSVDVRAAELAEDAGVIGAAAQVIERMLV